MNRKSRARCYEFFTNKFSANEIFPTHFSYHELFLTNKVKNAFFPSLVRPITSVRLCNKIVIVFID